jgi:uncharacterized protein (DUF433 family)
MQTFKIKSIIDKYRQNEEADQLKSEYRNRNPKQIQNANVKITKTIRFKYRFAL